MEEEVATATTTTTTTTTQVVRKRGKRGSSSSSSFSSSLYGKNTRSNHHQTAATTTALNVTPQWISKRMAPYRSLCSMPVFLVAMIAALDSGDKQLLSGSFAVLERTLGFHVDTLGYFSMCTNLSYALSLPFWGWLVHKYGLDKTHLILASACFLWGVATICTALFGTHFVLQALFRAVNGFALASILPLTQTMLVELVPAHQKGRAFGILSLMESIAASLAGAAIVWSEDAWRVPYSVVGILSIIMAIVCATTLRIPTGKGQGSKDGEEQGGIGHLSQLGEDDDLIDRKTATKKLAPFEIIRRVTKNPVFTCLVAQGIFGGIPWDMFGFHLLLHKWRNFSNEQIIAHSMVVGLFGSFGASIGGVLGDYFGATDPRGRVAVAIVSVVLGMCFYSWSVLTTSYIWCVVFNCSFFLVALWTPAAALRPICADLAENASERAQIVAFWVLLEKVSSSLFGAPLVGYLTQGMIDQGAKEEGGTELSSDEQHKKFLALSHNLAMLACFFWSICVFFWILMGLSMKNSTLGTGVRSEGNSSKTDFRKIKAHDSKV